MGHRAPNQKVTIVSVLKQAIADAEDIEKEELFVDQWNVTIGVKSMDGHARARIIEQFADADGTVSFAKLYPELLIQCTYDPDTGLPVFEDTAADRELILSKSGNALDAVAKKAMEMSGLDAKAEERVGKD